MTLKQFSIIRSSIILLIGLIILTAFLINELLLAIAGFLIGVLFIFLVQKKFQKVIIDERVLTVSGQAARATYVYATIFLGLLSIFLIFSGRQHEGIYVESVGITLGYVAIFNIALYAVFFRYYNKKYGGDK